MKIAGLKEAVTTVKDKPEVTFKEGVKTFKIVTAEEGNMFDWADFHVIMTLRAEGVPFDVKFDLVGSGPSSGKKGTLFKLVSLLASTGIEVDSDGGFNIKDLEGKSFKAYLYRNDAGYARVHDMIYTTGDADTYIANRFNIDSSKGYVRQLSSSDAVGNASDDDDASAPPF